MPKQKASYEALLEEVVETLKHSPDGVNEIRRILCEIRRCGE